MKEQLEKRLEELKSEFESGQQVLAELETKQINLRETLLRISGAIQVIEEELAKTGDSNASSVSDQDTAEFDQSLEVSSNSMLQSVTTS